jgi:hypothetical protein
MTRVDRECFAKTVIREAKQPQAWKDICQTLIPFASLCSGGNEKAADAALHQNGLGQRIGAATLIASGALQCLVVKQACGMTARDLSLSCCPCPTSFSTRKAPPAESH